MRLMNLLQFDSIWTIIITISKKGIMLSEKIIGRGKREERREC